MSNELVAEGSLKIDGLAVAGNSVPADVLASAVSRMQRLLLIMAAAADDKGIKVRFKPDATLRARHVLLCGVPKAGSYHVPLQELDTQFDGHRVHGALQSTFELVGAVTADDDAVVSRLLPQEALRERALQELESAAPTEDSDWFMSLQVGSSVAIMIDYRLGRQASKMRHRKLQMEDTGHVIGPLQQMQFADRRLKLVHPKTSMTIECGYPAAFEESLFESRTGNVCIKGQVTRNAEGDVVEVVGETIIEQVKLDPFELAEVSDVDLVLKINPPLHVAPRLDEESGQFLLYDNELLHIHVAAPSRDELREEIKIQVSVAWREYAMVPDDDLSPSGLRLKKALHQLITKQ